jgi:hypothetical protein
LPSGFPIKTLCASHLSPIHHRTIFRTLISWMKFIKKPTNGLWFY